MKHILILALFQFTGLCFELIAQDITSFTVKAGQSFNDVLTFDQIYSYPEFREGVVFYSNGTSSSAVLNYSIIRGKMEFINSRRDTLVIANSEIIDSVILNNDTYYVSDDEYYRRSAGERTFALFERRFLKLTDIKTKGAYGTTSSTSAVDNYSSFISNSNTRTYQLKADEDMVFSFRTSYYFQTRSRDLFSAQQNTLLKSFPEYSASIKKFIKENSIKFTREADLVKMADFMTETIMR